MDSILDNKGVFEMLYFSDKKSTINGFNLFLFNYSCLLRDIDPVKKFTNILIFDSGWLLNTSCWSRYQLDIIAFNDQLIFQRCWIHASNSWLHPNSSDVLFTKKVPDLDHLIVLVSGTIDGEMSIYWSHPILEPFSDPFEHVLNMGANSSNGGQFFACAEPFLYEELLLANHLEIQLRLIEVSNQCPTRSTNDDLSVLYFDGDIVRYDDRLIRTNSLHSRWPTNRLITWAMELN